MAYNDLLAFIKNKLPAYKMKAMEKQLAVANEIAYRYKHKRMKQKELAEAMGVEPSYLNRILGGGGSNMTIETIAKAEVALDCDLLMTPTQFEDLLVADANRMREVYQRYLGTQGIWSNINLGVWAMTPDFKNNIGLRDMSGISGVVSGYLTNQISIERANYLGNIEAMTMNSDFINKATTQTPKASIDKDEYKYKIAA